MSPTPLQPPDSPDQDPRLPELLEACLEAERAAPGSSAELVRTAPEGLRDELAQLIALARVLETAPWAAATPRLRAAAAARLDRQSQPATRRSGPARRPRRVAPWVPRAAAIVAAVALSGYGSVLASAGALPGEPLYRVKQANEFVMLQLSRDDTTRALVLLRQAGTRLEEAMRLAGAGQVRSAGEVLQQYVATLGRATASLRQAQGSSTQQAPAEFEAELQHQRDRLQALARDAPQPLRPSIQEAQVAVSRDLGSSPDASGVGLGRPTPAAVPATSPIPAASPSVGAPVRPAPSPSPTSSPVGQATPVESVRRFYELVQQEQGDQAASLWSPRLRAAFPPAENIAARFSHTRALVVERAELLVLDEAAGRATVAIVLQEELDGAPWERRYTGTWDLIRGADGWLLDEPDLHTH